MISLRWSWLVPVLAVLVVATLRGQSGSSDKDGKDAAGAAGTAKEFQLVERLLAARKEYQKTLEQLRKHYIAAGDLPKARWAEDELLQYHRMAKQAFLLPLDVPPPTLKGQTNIRAANQLYIHAMSYKDKGWSTEYIDNQRRAEILLQRLLTEYPQSDKISDAAYQLGDLYEGRAFKQYERAAAYYDRCYEWNPKTHHDARLRAARLYDRELKNHVKARAIYQLIQQHELDDRRIEEATRRMNELSNRR
jgi:TolA-binding protein